MVKICFPYHTVTVIYLTVAGEIYIIVAYSYRLCKMAKYNPRATLIVTIKSIISYQLINNYQFNGIRRFIQKVV